MTDIRRFNKTDWPALWKIIEPVFRSGDTYVYSPDISEEDAYKIWVDLPEETYVAVNEKGDIIGTYYIKQNQPGLGSHVCNCGYIVSSDVRNRGIASDMCIHSQQEAMARGYRAMQFNFVVSTNEGAIRLWKKLGFDIVETLPKAFKHHKLGFVDAFVMFKQLEK
jgi:RimJ/RimL family protein N-acetyltransferase